MKRFIFLTLTVLLTLYTLRALTDADMQNLKITEAEKTFGEQYVVFMNELIKQQ